MLFFPYALAIQSIVQLLYKLIAISILMHECFTISYALYDSNIYFGALISFFDPSLARTYKIEHLPFSMEDVSQF